MRRRAAAYFRFRGSRIAETVASKAARFRATSDSAESGSGDCALSPPARTRRNAAAMGRNVRWEGMPGMTRKHKQRGDGAQAFNPAPSGAPQCRPPQSPCACYSRVTWFSRLKWTFPPIDTSVPTSGVAWSVRGPSSVIFKSWKAFSERRMLPINSRFMAMGLPVPT